MERRKKKKEGKKKEKKEGKEAFLLKAEKERSPKTSPGMIMEKVRQSER